MKSEFNAAGSISDWVCHFEKKHLEDAHTHILSVCLSLSLSLKEYSDYLCLAVQYFQEKSLCREKITYSDFRARDTPTLVYWSQESRSNWLGTSATNDTCDQIPFWVRKLVTETQAKRTPYSNSLDITISSHLIIDNLHTQTTFARSRTTMVE